MDERSVLWRRLDTAGHDACRLVEEAGGWRLDGAAVFRYNGLAARLDYQVTCDRAWVSQQGRVRGWVGNRSVAVDILRRSDGVWTMDGAAVPAVAGCVDLDFGFTPATNLFQLARLSLAEGQGADVPVAWLDVEVTSLGLLPQRYERRSATTYWYLAPTAGYQGLLEVTPVGFVRIYPGLWTLEPQE
jgi:hypothetical protein